MAETSEQQSVERLQEPCEHPAFDSTVNAYRLTDGRGTVTSFRAEVHIACAACRQPFRFIGLPFGVLAENPAMSVDGQELRAPIEPSNGDLFPLNPTARRQVS